MKEIEDLKKLIESKEGEAAVLKAIREANEVTDHLDKLRRVTREQMQRPFDI